MTCHDALILAAIPLAGATLMFASLVVYVLIRDALK